MLPDLDKLAQYRRRGDNVQNQRDHAEKEGEVHHPSPFNFEVSLQKEGIAASVTNQEEVSKKKKKK